jgi:DNA-directed RNA polymerase subunit RPC12/RpoP
MKATTPASAAPAVPPNAIPEHKPPTLTAIPPTDRKFPCKNCGARLDFDPASRALACPYCGHTETIAPDTLKVQEHDYTLALKNLNNPTGTIAGRSSETRCPGCGATVLLEDNIQTATCPFCATHLENAPRTAAQSLICPESLLPFKIPQRQAIDAFNRWIASRWFAPTNLKQLANLGQLSGVYLPFWTYDSMTYSHYVGQRGDNYWETEYYTDARNNQQSRQVLRTRWSYVSGEVDHFFDDILVCASKSLPPKNITHLEPWDIQDLESFKSEYLAGFKTERYVVPLNEGFAAAQEIMAARIRALCEQNIGGDHQNLTAVNTQHVGITYKHILLPLWLAVYRYNNTTYRILVNARTGLVTGDRPYSLAKITATVLAALVALIIMILILTHLH